jgi:hypothetical protein
MSIPEINLQQYHTNAVTAIAGKFTADIQGAFAYKTFDGEVPLSISIELDSIFPSAPYDTGTEQFHGEFRFSAYVVVPFTKEGADANYSPKLIVRQISTRLVGFIRGNRFGCPVGDARILSAAPDEFSLPGKSGRAGKTEEYEVWRIEWEFDAVIGEDAWKVPADTVLPVEVWTVHHGEETQVVP